MQNRDIGDIVKYTIFRGLSEGRHFGVARYLYPGESAKGDGRHVDYLDRQKEWRRLDGTLFDAMEMLVRDGRRSVADVEQSGVLGSAVFAGQCLVTDLHGRRRGEWWRQWFDLPKPGVVEPPVDIGSANRVIGGSVVEWRQSVRIRSGGICSSGQQ